MKTFFLVLMLLPICVYAQKNPKNTNYGANYGSQHIGDVYNQQGIIKGILLPFPTQSTTEYRLDLGAKISMSQRLITKNYLSDYAELPFAINCSDPLTPDDFSKVEQPSDLKFKFVDNKIFVSVTIRDLKTGAIVARIKDNKWIIKKAYDWSSTDKHLEVLDDYGYVALRIEVLDGVIVVRGYAIGQYCALFMTDSGLRFVSKNEAELVRNASKIPVKYCKDLPER